MRILSLLIILSFIYVSYSSHVNSTNAFNVDCDNIVVGEHSFSLSRLVNFGRIETHIGFYTYYFSVCKNVNLPDESYCGKCQEFGGCQSYINEDDGEERACLGEFTNSLSDITANENSISLTYTNGDLLPDDECWNGKPRQLIIYIECDEYKDIPKAINVEEPQCDDTYYIRFKHADGCPKGSSPSPGPAPKKKGLSPGSVMLIIIFVSFFVYLIAGVIVNVAIRKKEGKEIIPNVSFWSDLPYLIKDGFVFALDKVRGRSSSTYQTVE